MRKRSSTVSGFLEYGQKHTTTIWTHDTSFHAGDVVVNLSSWPGLAKGDIIQLSRAGFETTPANAFIFMVDDDSIAGPKSTVCCLLEAFTLVREAPTLAA